MVALVVALAGCGTDGGIGEASATLAPRVAAIRAAAANGDAAAAVGELAALRQSVASLRAAGELSDDDAARVLTASAEVEAELATLAPSVPSPQTASTVAGAVTTTSTTSTSSPPAAQHKEPKGKGKAEDNGNKDGGH
jgi:hypothetical protein